MPLEDARAELLALSRSAAELLRWERDLSGCGISTKAPPQAVRAALAPGQAPVEQAAPEALEAPVEAAASAQYLLRLAEQAASCTACRLHEGRHRSVFARGSEQAELCFIGEGPGYHEDQEGLPFVGQAGALLDKMVRAMGFAQGEVYVCNVVKCRPPDNRTPRADEAAACAHFLDAQVARVAPRVIVALGRSAAERLGCIDEETRGWRGSWSSYRDVPVMSTYHPAYLLRTPAAKRQVWDDLQAVVARLGRELPKPG